MATHYKGSKEIEQDHPNSDPLLEEGNIWTINEIDDNNNNDDTIMSSVLSYSASHSDSL